MERFEGEPNPAASRVLAELYDSIGDLSPRQGQVPRPLGQRPDNHDETLRAKERGLLDRMFVVLQTRAKTVLRRRRQIGRAAVTGHLQPRVANMPRHGGDIAFREIAPPGADSAKSGARDIFDHAIDRRPVSERRGVDRTEVEPSGKGPHHASKP